MRKSFLLSAVVGTMMLLQMPATASAQDPAGRKLTLMTFSDTVQLPGFTLPAGTYRFSLADADSDRRVIEVTNEDGSKPYGFFLTIPDQTAKPSGKPFVLFNEMPAGTPPALRTWFYPQETYGYELVYPKNQAASIAKATHQRILATDEGGDRAKLHGAKVGRVDENGDFSDDTKATSGSADTKPSPTDQNGSRAK